MRSKPRSRLGGIARWGGVIFAGLFGAIGIAPLAPEILALTVAADAVARLFEVADSAIGAVQTRALLSAGCFALLALPLTGRASMGGGRNFVAVVAIICGFIVASALAMGMGGEIVRRSTSDPGAPSISEASILFGFGYQIGYLGLVDRAGAWLLPALEASWPGLAAGKARLAPLMETPLAVFLFASIVSLGALAPVFAARLVLASLSERMLRAGAMRFLAATLTGALFIGLCVGLDSLMSAPPSPPAPPK
ncbi:MAG: hypothetical protein MRY74_02840 [Neomegalonema sp.]|nr:hypothetical protein [Neomegalonema sp.]